MQHNQLQSSSEGFKASLAPPANLQSFDSTLLATREFCKKKEWEGIKNILEAWASDPALSGAPLMKLLNISSPEAKSIISLMIIFGAPLDLLKRTIELRGVLMHRISIKGRDGQITKDCSLLHAVNGKGMFNHSLFLLDEGINPSVVNNRGEPPLLYLIYSKPPE